VTLLLQNEYGDSALKWASEKGFDSIVGKLLDKGADTDIKVSTTTYN